MAVSNNNWKQYIQEQIKNGLLDDNFKINADRILKNEYLFDNEYAMEPTHISYQLNPILWNESPNGDPEWLYMLKRQEYLLDLLESYYDTNNTIYQEKMKSLLFDWIDNNIDNEQTWRTIDTGIRLLNWASVVDNLIKEEKLEKKENQSIAQAVKKQVIYLYNNYIEKYDLSNWGVLITTGILTYDAKLKGVIPSEITNWAQSRLEEQLDLQIDSQGVHWEQSPLYLLEVWRSTLAVIAAQQSSKISVSNILIDKMKRVHNVIPHYLKPDYSLIQQGDTDAIPIDSLYNISAIILNEGNCLAENISNVCDFCLLELKHEKISVAPKATELSPFFAGKLSGNYMWRSSWKKEADYWHLFNGKLGSGHDHASLSHVDLVINGHDILVDPGRYTYINSVERRFLKGASAHNCIIIDDTPFSKPKNSWKFDYTSSPLSIQVLNFFAGNIIKSEYLDKSSENTIVTRYWISFFAPQIFVAVDIIRTNGKHNVKHYWQISPDLEVSKRDGKYLLGKQATLSSSIAYSDESLSLFSPKYNNLKHCSQIVYNHEINDNSIEATVIAAKSISPTIEKVNVEQSGSGNQVGTRLAWGCRINLADGKNFLITTQIEDTTDGRKLYLYDKTKAYGTFNIFERQGQQVTKHFNLL